MHYSKLCQSYMMLGLLLYTQSLSLSLWQPPRLLHSSWALSSATQSDFISENLTQREHFEWHPWSKGKNSSDGAKTEASISIHSKGETLLVFWKHRRKHELRPISFRLVVLLYHLSLFRVLEPADRKCINEKGHGNPFILQIMWTQQLHNVIFKFLLIFKFISLDWNGVFNWLSFVVGDGGREVVCVCFICFNQRIHMSFYLHLGEYWACDHEQNLRSWS